MEHGASGDQRAPLPTDRARGSGGDAWIPILDGRNTTAVRGGSDLRREKMPARRTAF
ncbi:hypothetical protein JOH52_005927 [Sinorhizobium meliloti]|nr:hypothetical protein [Sinorhizobium meliloti]GEC41196.1 hypothetical protein EME01_52680 [Sinorhizobium meliloti]